MIKHKKNYRNIFVVNIDLDAFRYKLHSLIDTEYSLKEDLKFRFLKTNNKKYFGEINDKSFKIQIKNITNTFESNFRSRINGNYLVINNKIHVKLVFKLTKTNKFLLFFFVFVSLFIIFYSLVVNDETITFGILFPLMLIIGILFFSKINLELSRKFFINDLIKLFGNLPGNVPNGTFNNK
jgi:hypothetical protein